MKQFKIGQTSAVALLAAAGLLAAGGAYAGTVAVAGGPLQYNAATVVGNNGNINVPSNTVTYTPAAGGTQTAGSTITFALPTGQTFGSNPSVTVGGAGATLAYNATPSAGGLGSNFVTFTVTAAGTATDTTTLNAFTIQNGASLGTPTATALKISAQAANNTVAAANDATAATANFLISSAGVNIAPVVQAGSLQVDYSSASGGKKFVTGGNSTATNGYAGSITVVGDTSRSAATAVAGTATTPATTTVILTASSGVFGAISNVYLVPGVTNCSSVTVTGTLTSSPSGSSVTFGNVTSNQAYGVCLGANGTTAIQPSGTISVTTNSVAGTTNSSYLAATPVTLNAAASSLLASFNGGPVPFLQGVSAGTGNQFIAPFVTGNDTSYQTYVRVTNNDTAAQTFTATITPYNQSTGAQVIAPVTYAIGTVPAGSTQILPITAITGTGLANSGAKAMISLTVSGTGATVPNGTSFSTILISPNGTLTNVQ